jgi:signal transduction histidine kinase
MNDPNPALMRELHTEHGAALCRYALRLHYALHALPLTWQEMGVTLRPPGGTLRLARTSAQVAAYYVVAEALTNAAKHAQASKVNVCVEARTPTSHPGRAHPV